MLRRLGLSARLRAGTWVTDDRRAEAKRQDARHRLPLRPPPPPSSAPCIVESTTSRPNETPPRRSYAQGRSGRHPIPILSGTQEAQDKARSRRRTRLRTLVPYAITALAAAGSAAITYDLARESRALSARTVNPEVDLIAGIVHREVDLIAREVRDLRKQVDRLTGKTTPDAVIDPGLELPIRGASAGRFEQEFARVRREVVDLALALNAMKAWGEDPGGQATRAAGRAIQRVDRGASTWALEVGGPVKNLGITISNLGTSVVESPSVTVNGKKRWSSTEAILEEILTQGMSDRDKALAIWSFIKDNRYHDSPAHRDIETHDPVRYLNVYGYGYCDDSATVFQALAEASGLRARVWELSGHVVPEVYFGGGWHVLDPDGEVYYLEDDGRTIASVQTLQQRPDIIRRHPSQDVYDSDPDMLVRVYTSAEDNQVSEWYRKTSETAHRIEFRLRPGEIIYRSFGNWGLYFSSRFMSEPKRYGNGRFVYEAPLERGLFALGNEVSGLRMIRDGASVALGRGTGARGTWVVPVDSPYPLLSGDLTMRVIIGSRGRSRNGEASGSVGVDVSLDGARWRRIAAMEEPGFSEISRSLRPYLPNGHGRPTYRYLLRITLEGEARILSLRLASDFQHAPHALPALEAGTNRVEYSDRSDRRDVEVRFDYEPASSAETGTQAARD